MSSTCKRCESQTYLLWHFYLLYSTNQIWQHRSKVLLHYQEPLERDMQHWRSFNQHKRDNARLHPYDIGAHRNFSIVKRRSQLRQVDEWNMLFRSCETQTSPRLLARDFKTTSRLYGKQPTWPNRGWNSYASVLAERTCHLPGAPWSCHQSYLTRPKSMLKATSILHAKHFPQTYG